MNNEFFIINMKSILVVIFLQFNKPTKYLISFMYIINSTLQSVVGLQLHQSILLNKPVVLIAWQTSV